MVFTLTAQVRTDYPGAVLLSVVGDAGVASRIDRIDGSDAAQPVRNYDSTGSGIEQVTDMEAPLGRAVSYNLLSASGAILAQSGQVVCPPLPGGGGLLRSVLKPFAGWMVVEPQDETGVEWASSTTVHEVVGSDTPIVVGEVRQRHKGIMSFLCKSIPAADQLVKMLRDGIPFLLRHDPCAQAQTRDILFYALNVSEVRYKRAGWRLVIVDYQTTAFVPGVTEEPPSSWTFEALAASAADFGELASHYATFADMALDNRLAVPA